MVEQYNRFKDAAAHHLHGKIKIIWLLLHIPKEKEVKEYEGWSVSLKSVAQPHGKSGASRGTLLFIGDGLTKQSTSS